MIEEFLGHPAGNHDEPQAVLPGSPPLSVIVTINGVTEEQDQQLDIPEVGPVPGKHQGSKTTDKLRPGQASFSEVVRHNYYRQCAISGAKLRPR